MSLDFTRENLVPLIQGWMDANNSGPSELERQAGVGKDCVRDFLRGKVHIPRADKLQKILRVVAPDEKF